MKNTAQPVGHSPSWHAQQKAYSSVYVIWDSLGRRVAETAGLDPDDGRPGAPGTIAGNEANAHLLSSAPDLLAAAEAILARLIAYPTHLPETPEMRDLRAAIAKARP